MSINFRERDTKRTHTVMCSPVSIQISQLVCLIKVLHCLGLVRGATPVKLSRTFFLPVFLCFCVSQCARSWWVWFLVNKRLPKPSKTGIFGPLGRSRFKHKRAKTRQTHIIEVCTWNEIVYKMDLWIYTRILKNILKIYSTHFFYDNLIRFNSFEYIITPITYSCVTVLLLRLQLV